MISIIKNIGGIITYDIDLNDVVTLAVDSILIEDHLIRKIDCSLDLQYDNLIDAKGLFLTPGFIDSHTHLVFSSNRSKDFDKRVSGYTYQEIANSGGGIKSSIESLKNSTKEELVNSCIKNVDRILKSGTTTVEAKSGYGLTLIDEIKSLEVIKNLNDKSNIDIVSTFMGAHDFPHDNPSQDSYIDLLCTEMIPEVSSNNLAEFCDVFCEDGYFDSGQTTKISEKAREYNLDMKLHVDEFSDSNGAFLAGELGVVSADHLMKSNYKGLLNMAQNNVVATILPGTTLFLGLDSFANGSKMIEAGCDVAIATDFNPGSNTIYSMPTIMALSSLYCGLSIKDSFKAATYNGAKAIKRQNSIGLIKEGYNADILFWDIENINEIPYWFNSDRISMIMKNGKLV